MAVDRIVEIRIEGMRLVKALRLRLDGLTVLIGENGTGKSTIIEACEVLRRAAGSNFIDEVHRFHGGPSGLLRLGAQELKLGITIEGESPKLDYDVTLGRQGQGLDVVEERLDMQRPVPLPSDPPEARHRPLERTRSEATYWLAGKGEQQRLGTPDSRFLVLTTFGNTAPNPEIARVIAALKGIDVHVAFDVIPAWASRALNRPSALRGSQQIQPATRLDLLGSNLASAYQQLKNGMSEWSETLEYVRMGLGDDVQDVNLRADPAGGAIALGLRYRGFNEDVLSSSLSDGALAYLALVAAVRLGGGRTLLALDEPELHLHPALVARVVTFLEAISSMHPVLVATQSDQLLDALSDPATSVRVCAKDSAQALELQSLDRGSLASWLEDYRGFGEIRGAGHERSVVADRELPPR